MKRFISLTFCFLVIFLLVSLFQSTSYSQKLKSKSLKLDNEKPSFFISYERSEKQLPLFEGESENRIWLRLNNNTKMKVFICGFNVKKTYGDVGVYYDVERIEYISNSIKSTSNTEPDPNTYKGELPLGYGGADDCKVYTILSGKSVLFSLPKEHLAKGLIIKTRFYYGWTGDWSQDIFDGTFHFTKFSSNEIPSR